MRLTCIAEANHKFISEKVFEGDHKYVWERVGEWMSEAYRKAHESDELFALRLDISEGVSEAERNGWNELP